MRLSFPRTLPTSPLALVALCGALFLALAALLPAGARAQTTTASLEGVVTDDTGETLPGANVVAVHEPTGTRYGATTGGEGRYRILNMRVGGPYTVEASFVGFATSREGGIRLQLDTERTIDFELSSETQELQEVEVVAERNATISANRTGASLNVSEEEIDRLPSISRSIQDFARLIPQATGSGGANSIAGRSARYNSIQIDGATLNDVFGLSGSGTPGGQAGAQPISLDAIQEFNVEIAPFDVRSSGFTGGQINAITKSGTNEFTGSFRFRHGREEFTGEINDEGFSELSDFSQEYYVGTLGGPIIEDQLFFFVSGELKREGSPLQGAEIFNPGIGVLDEITQAADEVYGYDVGGIGAIDNDENDDKLLVKLDWNINDSNRLTARHNYVNARQDDGLSRFNDNFNFGGSNFVRNSVQNSSTLQLNSTISNNMLNEARLVYTNIDFNRDPSGSLFPNATFALPGDNTARIGLDRFSQANALDQDLFEISNDFTYLFDDHTLTLGTNTKIFRFQNLFIQDVAGAYTFAPFSYENAQGEDVEVSAIEAFRRGQPTQYFYSYATPAAGTDRPVAEFSAYQPSVYVQDEWQVNDDFRVTGGLRLDVPILPEDPTFNPTAFEAFGRSTSDVASGNMLWSPRVGFNYNLNTYSDDFTTQFRGGVGIFSGDPPYVFISNQYSNTGADLFRLSASFDPGGDFVDENGNYDPDQRFVPTDIGENPTDQPRPGEDNALSPVETTEINLTSTDFDYPQTLRTNLAVDQELPLQFVATLEGLYSNTLNDVTFRDLNMTINEGAGLNGQSLYGRPLYGGAPASDRFTNAILLENTNEGYEYSLTGQLQRRVSQGLSGSLSYTFNRAESVNNGTSSRAISNWQYNETVDLNNAELGTADFEVRHRLLTTLNYSFEWGSLVGDGGDRFSTALGLIFESRSGEPFSWVYGGNANFDTSPAFTGSSRNDLVFVPDTERDVVLESENWESLDAFIESQPALDEARGEIIERNTARADWQNILDLRLSQRVETFEGQNIEFNVNVENFLNVLNEDWGRIRRPQFNSEVAWSFNGYVQESDVGSRIAGRLITEDDVGKPRISFDEDTSRSILRDDLLTPSNIFSRWRLRLGVRYTF